MNRAEAIAALMIARERGTAVRYEGDRGAGPMIGPGWAVPDRGDWLYYEDGGDEGSPGLSCLAPWERNDNDDR